MTAKLTDKQVDILWDNFVCPKCGSGDGMDNRDKRYFCLNEDRTLCWEGTTRDLIEAAMKRAGVEIMEPRRSDDLTEEVDMLRQSLKDARRALAMTRGEEWPDDWHYDEGALGWWSPTWSAVIKRVEADNGGILWDMRVPYPQGWVSVTPMPFPDPLAALRAFEAGGF